MANFEERFDKKFKKLFLTPSVADFTNATYAGDNVKSFIKSELNNLLDRVEKEVIGKDDEIKGITPLEDPLLTSELIKRKSDYISWVAPKNRLREEQRSTLKKI